MLGAIIGDIIGSVHEFVGTKTKDFPLFVPESKPTDDTVLTIAVADWILSDGDLVALLRAYTRDYPNCGYGLGYRKWAASGSREPYHSYGNGSAMRASPIGVAFDTIEEVLSRAERSAAVTHNHPEGIRGAQATAAAMFFARHIRDKSEIRRLLEGQFGYDLSSTLDEIRPTYRFNETCQETVPQALIAFLESTSYEDAVRNAISLGGDADTLACIAGGIAEAFYGGVPEEIAGPGLRLLDERLTTVVDRFRERFGSS
ncbi:MAG: ADP-ribosylglycohydrolase family protein [bacterium]